MGNVFATVRPSTANRRQPCTWLRCLPTILLILVLISLLGHFVLEAGGAAPDKLEMSVLHSSILSLIIPLFAVTLIRAELALPPRLLPSLWSPPPRLRPPVTLR